MALRGFFLVWFGMAWHGIILELHGIAWSFFSMPWFFCWHGRDIFGMARRDMGLFFGIAWIFFGMVWDGVAWFLCLEFHGIAKHGVFLAWHLMAWHVFF